MNDYEIRAFWGNVPITVIIYGYNGAVGIETIRK